MFGLGAALRYQTIYRRTPGVTVTTGFLLISGTDFLLISGTDRLLLS